MKKLTTFVCTALAVGSVSAQTLIQAYKNRADLVSQTNITTNLQQFSNLGIKTTGSVNNVNTLTWIKNKYTSFGYSASQIAEDPFTFGSTSSKNLVITKTGTLYPNKYVIICGHFDTITGPGTSDNGSGTSVILEVARILKDVPTEYSIKFIHFSGEEQGLYGSAHYANNVEFQSGVRKLDIKLVFNLDQVGGKIGNVNNKIICERDTSGQSGNNAASNTVTQQLATCTTLYSPLQTSISNAYSSDYMPFEQKGDVITGFYEYTRSYNEHTTNDTFANVDPVYVFKVAKAAVGAMQHFATASSTVPPVSASKEKPLTTLESVKMYPNPAKNILNIEWPDSGTGNFTVEITNLSGLSMLKDENTSQLNISSLKNGIYLCTVNKQGSSVTRKIIIEK
ncbi:leucyl aminopeptidase [Chryseobacterium shigense]|uniref:Aminopeptidase YwaD n=1 Tax=Chryseobacterium shigense TaxID=297244 RepID=A0A1N7HT63_9FLAO|nr:M28 family peptidase [Chryseobacterium shigense]PQA93075.1 leucyl aminopeptidase [Chryseobacterium shigense]SIS28044.1 aminopeptidase YwaD [Chryseobacterium shigense]